MTDNQERLLREALHHIDKAHDTVIESIHGCSGNFAQARKKINKALLARRSNKMHWTTKRPTEPGYYWGMFRLKKNFLIPL